MYSEEREGDTGVLCPAEKGLLEEGNGDHSALVVRCDKGKQTTPYDHSCKGDYEGPFERHKLGGEVAKGNQEKRPKDKADVARQGQKQRLMARRSRRGIEDVDHSWIDDIYAVVEHSDDKGDDEGNGKLAAFVRNEYCRRAQLILCSRKLFPKTKGDQKREANNHWRDNVDVVRRLVGGINDAHEGQD